MLTVERRDCRFAVAKNEKTALGSRRSFRISVFRLTRRMTPCVVTGGRRSQGRQSPAASRTQTRVEDWVTVKNPDAPPRRGLSRDETDCVEMLALCGLWADA
jgi:hypothetical protein